MRVLALVLLFSSISIQALGAYDCENKDFRIEISDFARADLSPNQDDIMSALFDNDITVTVTEKSTGISTTYDKVAAIADGAGQDSYQSFIMDGLLIPMQMRTNFYFEHEGGCLEGSVYSETNKVWYEIDSCWGNSENRMMCEENW